MAAAGPDALQRSAADLYQAKPNTLKSGEAECFPAKTLQILDAVNDDRSA